MIKIASFTNDEDQFPIAEFGRGDISMVSTEVSEKGVVYLAFRNCEPRPIGSITDPVELILEDTKPQIMFSFNKIESIDALMSTLQDCKAELLKAPAQKPDNCTMDYDDAICPDCEHIVVEKVPHPGGDSKSLVDKLSCGLGYWEDDF